MPFANYPNLNHPHHSARAALLCQVERIPKQYAKPLRNTSYLHSHPHTVNGGFLYKNHEIYSGLFEYNHQHDNRLRDLFGRNEHDFSADRVKDARAFGWFNEPAHGTDYGSPMVPNRTVTAHWEVGRV